MDEQATPQANGTANGVKKHDKINGVFSTQIISKVGTGTTVRKTVKKTYWMVDEQDTGEVEIQPLNVNYVPSGPKRKVSKDEFLEKFSPEPEFYVNTVYPKMREMNMAVVEGEKHREKGESFSAELEFNHALTIDEENVRANFGLGLTYLERGDDSKANDIFQRLVKLEAAFETEHKHLFNEFGINLRKNKMFDQSVEYYQRALGLSQVDENLHYNIARAWFEKQNYAKVKEHLDEALRLNPAFEEGKKFLDYLAKKNLVSGGSGAPAAAGAKNGDSGDAPSSSGPINVDL